MTILFLTKEYNHEKLPPSGGIGTFIKTLAKELTNKGHKVYVFGISKKSIDFSDEEVTVHFEKSFFRKNRHFDLIKSLSKKFKLYKLHQYILDKERKYIARQVQKYIKKNTLTIDIIEAHDYDGLFKFLNPEIPYAVRCHGSAAFLEKYFGYDIDVFKINNEHSAFKRAENIIGVSDFCKTASEKLFGKNNIKLIYNGIKYQDFHFDKIEPIIENSIFYFGTLSEEKGAKAVCEIFNEVNKLRPETTLHLIGRNNNYWEFLKSDILTPQAAEKTIYYGTKTFPEIIDYIKKAHLFLFPSHGENLPLAFIEAMALSKPIIISDIQVSEEIIDHGKDGYIAKNKQEFINYTLRLLDDKVLCEQIGENARNKVIAKFSLDKMVDETIAYYQQIINK